MATSSLANPFLSYYSSSSSSHRHSTNAALPPPRVSLPTSRSHFVSTRLKTKKNFITHCSLDASSKDSKGEETPIELKYPAYPTVMDINQIREILPH